MNKIDIKWIKEKELKLKRPSFELDLKEMWVVDYTMRTRGFFNYN